MNSASERINILHDTYCRLAGVDLPMNMSREAVWYDWLQRGLTVADVVTLINHHKWRSAHDLPARSLKFRSIIANIDWAEEDLAEIRARQRAHYQPHNRTAVLAATGRVPPEGSQEPLAARPPAEVIESALKQLRQAVTTHHENTSRSSPAA